MLMPNMMVRERIGPIDLADQLRSRTDRRRQVLTEVRPLFCGLHEKQYQSTGNEAAAEAVG